MLPPPPEKQNKNCPSNTTPMRTRDTGTVVVRVENIALLGALHASYPPKTPGKKVEASLFSSDKFH